MVTTALTRRRLLQYGLAGGAALLLPRTATAPAATAAAPVKLTKYIESLPVPGNGIAVAAQSGANHYSFTQATISRQLHPDLPSTPVWAYDDGSGLGGQAGSFGMAVVAERGTPLTIDFTHDLPGTYPDWIPVDTRLTPLGDEVRLMTHLHGGFVDGDSDGNPAVTPNGFGPGETQTVHYLNQTPASLLWFHDHGLGATRLNVFAGLAAAYILRDEFDTGEPGNANDLPAGPYEIPIVVQDRLFDGEGRFLYPTSEFDDATWVGEYFGDVMLVNGKVWPYLEVEPRLYRFRILNGCNARILNLDVGGASMWQIGAEGGMWDRPVTVKKLVLAPAERADVLVDFSRHAGATTMVTNTPPPPPVSNPAPPLPQVMQIRVANATPVPPVIPTTLVGGVKADLPAPSVRRFMTLNEVEPETEEWFLDISGLRFDDDVTELPKQGAVEDWYYINLTGDTHPMHPHLVTHQVVGRMPFDVDAYSAAAGSGPNGVPGSLDPRPFATGSMIPPDPAERGFKDTTKANPGEFTIIRAKFDLPAGVSTPQMYVHHCHIVEHEDNDMMRPFEVIA
jgi:spore coat protein A, manganese oxidase